MTDYKPISCSLHDELEARATLRKQSTILYRNEQNELETTVAIIKDIYTRSGEEFILLDNGMEIRLDKIEKIDGTSFLTC